MDIKRLISATARLANPTKKPYVSGWCKMRRWNGHMPMSVGPCCYLMRSRFARVLVGHRMRTGMEIRANSFSVIS